MKAAKSAREFNVGPVNKKSGLAKGALAFGVEKLGEGQFRIVLPTPLGPGEKVRPERFSDFAPGMSDEGELFPVPATSPAPKKPG